jgi:hypothetical protein
MAAQALSKVCDDLEKGQVKWNNLEIAVYLQGQGRQVCSLARNLKQ